jgi:hypothetical protein
MKDEPRIPAQEPLKAKFPLIGGVDREPIALIKFLEETARCGWRGEIVAAHNSVRGIPKSEFLPRIAIGPRVYGSATTFPPVVCLAIQPGKDEQLLRRILPRDSHVLACYRTFQSSRMLVFVGVDAGSAQHYASCLQRILGYFKYNFGVAGEIDPSPMVGCDPKTWIRKKGGCVLFCAPESTEATPLPTAADSAPECKETTAPVAPVTPLSGERSPTPPADVPALAPKEPLAPTPLPSTEERGAVPVEALLTAQISFFETITRKTTPQVTTFWAYLEDVKRGLVKDTIDNLRRLDPDSKEAKAIKERLPAVKPGGLFTGLSAATLEERSGAMPAEFDAKDHPGRDLPGMRQWLLADEHVFAVHVSAGGAGLVVYVPVKADDDPTYKRCFAAAAAHFAAKFGLKVDSSGSDICRNRFVSYDPDCLWKKGGVVVPFQPAPTPVGSEPVPTVTEADGRLGQVRQDSPPVNEGVSHNNGTLSHNSKNEPSTPPPSSSGIEDPGSTGHPGTTSDPDRFSSKLYYNWVIKHHPAVQGTRNQTIRELAPILINIVGREMALTFLTKYYDDAAGVFLDPRSKHEQECRAMLAAVLRSYPTNATVGLNANERRIYATLDARRQDVFRIVRSLSRIPNNAGVAPLTDHHLGQRLGCDRTSSARALEYLVRDGIIELVERGEQWRPGMIGRKSSRYRWIAHLETTPVRTGGGGKPAISKPSAQP